MLARPLLMLASGLQIVLGIYTPPLAPQHDALQQAKVPVVQLKAPELCYTRYFQWSGRTTASQLLSRTSIPYRTETARSLSQKRICSKILWNEKRTKKRRYLIVLGFGRVVAEPQWTPMVINPETALTIKSLGWFRVVKQLVVSKSFIQTRVLQRFRLCR